MILGTLAAAATKRIPERLKELEGRIMQGGEKTAQEIPAMVAKNPADIEAAAKLAAEREEMARNWGKGWQDFSRELVSDHLVKSPTSVEIPEGPLFNHLLAHNAELIKQGTVSHEVGKYPLEHGERPSILMPEIHDASPEFQIMMARNGMAFDPDKGIYHFDPARAQNIIDESDLVSRSYDSDLQPGEEDAWTKYNLGGDDDVDYNGGYVQAGIEKLQHFLKGQ